MNIKKILRTIAEDAESHLLELPRRRKQQNHHMQKAVHRAAARHRENQQLNLPIVIQDVTDALGQKIKAHGLLQSKLALPPGIQAPVHLKRRPPPTLIFE